jgi:hypothetical protein
MGTSRKRARALLKKKSLAKELMRDAVKRIGDEVIKEKRNNGGKAPYGYASELVNDAKESIPKINLSLVNYYIKKQETQETTPPEPSAASTPTLSSLAHCQVNSVDLPWEAIVE